MTERLGHKPLYLGPDIPKPLETIGVLQTAMQEPLQQKDRWFYPAELANDLRDVALPPGFAPEAIACGWEYARCVIPHFTNWAKYIAFCRIIIVGVIAEFRGHLVDVTGSSTAVLGSYDVEKLLDTLFGGSGGTKLRDDMGREYRTFLLITAEKSSAGLDSELFRRYVNALVQSPKAWFRLRDCDALARFTMAAALACNDYTDTWFREDELDILTELCDTMYDAATYYKHRAEGETNSTFSYAPATLRTTSYRACRELLWQLDVAWAASPPHRCIVNFIRAFGGPIHLMMRRYRYVEDGLALGVPETEGIIAQTERNVKLWNRVAKAEEVSRLKKERFLGVVSRQGSLIDGMSKMLDGVGQERCAECRYREPCEAKVKGEFGGVKLCVGCEAEWRAYLEGLTDRVEAVFPFLHEVGKHSMPEPSLQGKGIKRKRDFCELGMNGPVSLPGLKRRRK